MNYFKPWRRKLGIVTLLFACAFAAAWVRSFSICDNLVCHTDGKHYHSVMSDWTGLAWLRSQEMTQAHVQYENFHFTRPASKATPWSYGDIKWKWYSIGFEIGEVWFKESGQLIIFCLVPYWSLVIPLTALSAWLLLSKLRQKTAKVTT